LYHDVILHQSSLAETVGNKSVASTHLCQGKPGDMETQVGEVPIFQCEQKMGRA